MFVMATWLVADWSPTGHVAQFLIELPGHIARCLVWTGLCRALGISVSSGWSLAGHRLVALLVTYLVFFIPGPGVIPLKHYGKREVLGKIANMEPEYDEPMYFYPDLLPATSVAAGHQGLWYYGIEVAGK